MSIQALEVAFRDALNPQPLLGKLGYVVSGVASVQTGDPALYNVRLDDGRFITAYHNNAVAPDFDRSVKLTTEIRDGKQIFVILGVAGGADGGNPGVSAHSHSRASGMYFEVDSWLISGFRVTPGFTSLTVQVGPGWYWYAGARHWFTGTIVDVSGEVPGASNQHCWTTLSFNPVDQTFSLTSTTAQSIALQLLEADIPAAPDDERELVALKLINSMTEVLDAYIVDMRAVLGRVDYLHSGAASLLTIASGTVVGGLGTYITLAAETGTADDLDTLTLSGPARLILLQAASGETITVKHNTGNIKLNGAVDFALSGDKTLALFWDGTTLADVGAGGGGSFDVSDGITTVTGASGIEFTTGATVTNNAGVAEVSITGGGGTTTQAIDVPQAFLVGFEFDWDGTTFTLQAGTCRNDDDTYTITKTSTTTINTGSTGAGGLDTGSLASNTWYYVWMIAKSSDGTTSAMLSTSSTAPTMPSGYDKKRRVGSIKTQSGSATLLRVWTERGAGTDRKFIYTDDFTLHRQDLAVTVTTAGTWYTCTVNHAPPTCLNVGLTLYSSAIVRLPIRPMTLSVTNGGFDIYINNSTSYVDVENIPLNSSQQFTVTRIAGAAVTLSWVTRWYQDTLIPTIVGSSSADTVQSASTTTTNSTATTLATIATATDIAYTVEATITARRTGGSSGSAGDGASYKLIASFKNNGGTLSQRGSTTNVMTVEDQAGWDAAFDTSGTDIRIRVTGATNNNISWKVSYTVTYV